MQPVPLMSWYRKKNKGMRKTTVYIFNRPNHKYPNIFWDIEKFPGYLENVKISRKFGEI